MGDAENNSQPSKKRSAGVQISRENPGLDDNDDSFEQEAGTFKRAPDEVLATRRIVKVRRPMTSAAAPAPAPPVSSNPFATIRLVPSSQNQETKQTDEAIKSGKKVDEARGDDVIKSENIADEPKGDDVIKSENVADEPKGDEVIKSENSESKVDDDSKAELVAQKDETEPAEVKNGKEDDDSETKQEEKKENGDGDAPKNEEAASFSSFQNLSSGNNAFSGITGTGFSSSSFSFGSLSKDGPSNSFFGLKNDNSSFFGSSASNTDTKSEGSKFPSMQEVSVETGEENEKAVFTADSAFFEFTDGSWKERGKGELKVNVPTCGTGKARLVMRARGNYRLILNASLFPDMKLTNMEKKGVTFMCVNSASEVKNGLSTIALKFKDPSFVEDFRVAVMEHKGKSGVALKTPENSPKASDE